jgi:hypothetical protein
LKETKKKDVEKMFLFSLGDPSILLHVFILRSNQ